MKNDPRENLVIPSANLLRVRLGVKSEADFEIDPEKLQQAEAALEALYESYPAWVTPDVDRMARLLTEMTGLSAKAQASHLEEIFDLAHNIKGQGLSFGYPLMTRIGESLCGFLRKKRAMDDATFRLIEAHIQAMQVVLRERIQDEKEPLAMQTVFALQAVGARLA